MKINKTSLFTIQHFPIDCHIDLGKGLNVLVGKNGIGKSSFFHFLKKHRRAYFDQPVAFMDQFPLRPMLDLTGLDIQNILKDEVPSFDLKLFNELADLFQFHKLLKQSVISYSGGENQIFKFMLMRAQKAQYYLMDEPFQYLDDINSEQLIHCIKKMSDKKILLIEHHQYKLQELQYSTIKMYQSHNRICIEPEGLDGN